MALIEVNAEFKLLVRQLIRIADALERAWPAPIQRKIEQVDENDLIRITDESLWLKEQEEAEKQESARSPEESR